jgi:hypothetical protein
MSEDTIDALLHNIQVQLKVPKARFNSFGKFYARSCEDILEAVKKILPKDAVILMEDEMVNIGDRFYVKATASLIYKDKYRNVTAWAREPLSKKGFDESQITGAASSYARKYALGGLFLIDDSSDPDMSNNDNKEQDDRKETLDIFIAMVNRLKIQPNVIQQWAEIANVSQIRDASTDNLKRFIAKMKQKEEELNNV